MEDAEILRRRILHSFVSNVALNHGFVKTEAFALETLAEMFIAFISQLSIQTKLFAELQNRTEPTFHDLASALIEIGIDVLSLYKFYKNLNNEKYQKIAEPAYASIQKRPAILHVIKPRPHQNYVFDHFPPFPDPHTYIQTECPSKSEREYQKTRELIAEQKLNIEKSLVKFRLKNQLIKFSAKQLSIFNEDSKDTAYMLIRNENENSDQVSPLITGLFSN
ncbi:transcription initiation factor TFIID subunit 8 [Brachionus plicatilis]|uniref:Transcription initiation factor TFIID subunit 8 n=1 Tax=Brachionus plicatilis TaxID=10195 RepID=A0A3M7SVP6_BRAPC|nr:transcription initiation factor TFIID subunit 8 [Brachionus plicatilis]